MSIYFFLYSLVSILSIIIGHFFQKKYKNISGYFFYFFVIFASTWYMLYFLFFAGIFSDPIILLYISRAAFTVGILSVYSLVFFFKYFDSLNKYFPKKEFYIIISVYFIFTIYTVFTNNIIEGLAYSPNDLVYREVYGNSYFMIPILYAIFFILFVYFGFHRVRTLSTLTGLRFRNIVFAACIFLFALIFLQVFLPLFNIWIFEKEIIFLYLFFVIYVFYSIKRYYFSPLYQEYGFIKIGVITGSFIGSITTLNIIKYLYFDSIPRIDIFWKTSDTLSFIDGSIILIAYYIFYNLLERLLRINSSEYRIKQNIDGLKQAISDSTTIDHLNKILQGGMRGIFKANYSKVVLFEDNEELKEFKKYFSHSLGEKIFINDIVFIEENKTKFSKDRICKELDKDTMLVFPITNTEGKCIGIYNIGKKPFGDFYTISEIKILFSLVRFLGLHAKYLSTYKKIQDYSLQLDQRIDDKTIEYNDLINQQKEFISMISHEIRSPIGSTIFQLDSLMADIDNGKVSTIDFKKNVESISEQLVNIGELLKKLFSIQYFDTRDVVLLKEKVQIGSLLEKEFEIYSRMYQDISFIKNISLDIGFVSLDKIHFQQVLTNLLENAIKFANPIDPVVLIECTMKEGGILRINIEDNGLGYSDVDTTTIFEKYSKGNHAKLGLGMGLYLCKRIITMHGGTITANHGASLQGASFVIELPV